LLQLFERSTTINKRVIELSAIVVVDARLRVMDRFDDSIQVICGPVFSNGMLFDSGKGSELHSGNHPLPRGTAPGR
jgi:hypothetical protein